MDESLSAVQQVEQRLNMSVVSVANAGELIQYAETNNMYEEHIAPLKRYLEQYQSNPL